MLIAPLSAPAIFFIVTPCRADHRLLRQRFDEWHHVLFLAADGRRRSAAHVESVWVVQRSDALRQLLRGRDVGREDGESRQRFQRQRYSLDDQSVSTVFVVCSCLQLDRYLPCDVRHRVPVPQRR